MDKVVISKNSGYMLKFKSNSPRLTLGNSTTITTNFKLIFWIKLNEIRAQYCVYIGNRFSIVYGFVANKFELYTENNSLPRTQFSTSVSDTSWHKIELEYIGGIISAKLDGVQQFSFSSSVDLNCSAIIVIGGFANGEGRYDFDDLNLDVNNTPLYRYSFNNPGSTIIDDLGNGGSVNLNGTNVLKLGSTSPVATITERRLPVSVKKGISGNSLAINSAQAIPNTGTLAALTNNFSVVFWRKKTNTSGTNFMLSNSSGSWTDSNLKFQFFENAGGYQIDKPGVAGIQIGSTKENRQWHFYVLTISSTTGVRLYIDGQLNGSSANTANMVDAKVFPSLGNGEYDEFRIYNRVLDLTEIQSLYSTANYNTTSLLLGYSFDESSGDVIDSTGVYTTPLSVGATRIPSTAPIRVIERRVMKNYSNPAMKIMSANAGYINPNNGIINDADDFTIEFWIRPLGNFAVEYQILNRGGSNQNIQIHLRSMQIKFGIVRTDGTSVIGSELFSASLNPHSWTHVACIMEKATTFRILINGSRFINAVTPTPGGYLRPSVTGVTFGYSPAIFQELRIWNVARTDQQILDNYKKKITSATGLVSRYTFDEASGNVLDKVGTNHGTIVGTIIRGTGNAPLS